MRNRIFQMKYIILFDNIFLNFLLGGSVGNSLGAITFMYSGLYCLMSLQFDALEYEDAKSCVSGALTGKWYTVVKFSY